MERIFRGRGLVVVVKDLRDVCEVSVYVGEVDFRHRQYGIAERHENVEQGCRRARQLIS